MKALLERFKAWWTSLNDRERRMVSAGGGVLALFAAYAAIWQPVHHWRAARAEALDDARAVATRLEAVGAEVQAGRGPRPVASGQSLFAMVDQSARASALGKAPTRVQPEGDAVVKVWLEEVSFDGVLHWLLDLETRYGVRVDSAEIERKSGPGLVNARLTLAK
jgi:general secretion pathway protein M